jgi:hypothetical protein
MAAFGNKSVFKILVLIYNTLIIQGHFIVIIPYIHTVYLEQTHFPLHSLLSVFGGFYYSVFTCIHAAYFILFIPRQSTIYIPVPLL